MSQTQVQSGFIGNNAVTTAKLDSTVSGALVPIGGIIMWSGSIATIPSSWRLCNGANGTPDLRERFIVGAGGDNPTVAGTAGYNPGNTGGLNSVILQTSQIASHNHSGSTADAGGHTHGGSTAGAGGHSHSGGTNVAGSHAHTYTGHRSSNYRTGSNTAEDTSKQQTESTGAAGNHSHSLTISAVGNHSHGVTIGAVGNHSHGVTIGNTGGNGAHENRPPYYALAFIMRTS